MFAILHFKLDIYTIFTVEIPLSVSERLLLIDSMICPHV